MPNLRESPNLIDVRGLGRPKEFSDQEEDFQQWSKSAEAFFAGVIKESEIMLHWAANRGRRLRVNPSISSSCRLGNMWKEVQNLEFVLQQVHTALMARTFYEANDIVANARQSPLKAWQR